MLSTQSSEVSSRVNDAPVPSYLPRPPLFTLVNFRPNVELEPMIWRSRVSPSTIWASQVPLLAPSSCLPLAVLGSLHFRNTKMAIWGLPFKTPSQPPPPSSPPGVP